MSISSILNNVSSDRNDNESNNGKLGNDDICSSASIIDNSLANSFNIGNSSMSSFSTIINSNDMINSRNCDHIDQLNSNIKYTTDDIFYGSDLTEVEESPKKFRGRKRSFPKDFKTCDDNKDDDNNNKDDNNNDDYNGDNDEKKNQIHKKRKLDKPAPSSSSPITKQKRKHDKNPPDSNVTTVTTAATTTTIPFPTTSNMPNATATFTSSQSNGKKNIFKCRVPGCEKVFSSSSNRSRHRRLKHPEDDIDNPFNIKSIKIKSINRCMNG
nr:11424_t:CDS:2 [Entrophospora candida]